MYKWINGSIYSKQLTHECMADATIYLLAVCISIMCRLANTHLVELTVTYS